MSLSYQFISILEIGANTFILFRISKNYKDDTITILSALQELALKHNKCFLYVDPYNYSDFMDNRDFFILYHKQSDKIVAWVNVINEIINTSSEKIYTTKIDKIVVIKNFANLTYIGTFLIKYILDIYINTPYRFYDFRSIPQYVEIITNVIYLYSLRIAKPFYDKIDELICLAKFNITHVMPPNPELIYINFPQIIDGNKNRKIPISRIMMSLNILHTFEIDEVDVDISIIDIDDNCYDLTPPIKGEESIVFEYIQQLNPTLMSKILIDKYIMTSKRDRARKKSTRSIIGKKTLNI